MYRFRVFIAGFAFVLRHGEKQTQSGDPNPSYLYFAKRKGKPKETKILQIKKGNYLNKDNNRTEILTFRVTPEEKKRIENKALSSYRLVSMYLRDCALDKEIIVIDGVKDVANELRHIGNNLNQITKAVNSGVYAVDLTETKKEVQKVWQSLNSLPQAVR